MRSRSIRSEREPLQIASHGALGAAEVIGEEFNAGAVTDVSRSIERLKIGETERASSLLAAATVCSSARVAEPCAIGDELALALERDCDAASDLVGPALQLAGL